MKIGLLRHYKVNIKIKSFMNGNQFMSFLNEYDNSGIIVGKKINEISWDSCFSSDLKRAYITAKTNFKGKVIYTKKLREVPMWPTISSKIKLPYFVWAFLSRLSWRFSKRKDKETYKDTLIRVENIITEIIESRNMETLVVCHGFLMLIIKRKLKELGFKGENFIKAKNGGLYIYERNC